jgi:hypothetical protein
MEKNIMPVERPHKSIYSKDFSKTLTLQAGSAQYKKTQTKKNSPKPQ